jgi:hypothetical protein
MKTNFSLKTILFILIAMSMIACDIFTEKNTECEATKMPSRQTPTVYLKLFLRNDTIVDSLYVHYATKATFSGTITKVYCDGTVSSTFEYNPTFYPVDMDYIPLNSGFYLSQPYEFNFDNDKDYLLIMAHLKVWFPGGMIYESEEVSRKYYYKDVLVDYIENKKFIFIPFGKGNYFQVASKSHDP